MVNRIVNGRARAPFILNIELTDYCPLHCRQCYKKAKTTYLNRDHLTGLISEAQTIGVKRILLSGGEPLSYPDLPEIVRLIKRAGIGAGISTGGCGMDRDTAYNLVNSGIDDIYISLNGSTEKINMLSRDGYEDAVSAMNMLGDMHIKYRVNWVARKDNINDFQNLIALCRSKGAQGIDILSNKPGYAGKMESVLDSLEIVQLAEICKRNPEYVQYQTCFIQLDKILGSTNSFFKGCLAGRASMAVFADGTFSVCPHIYTGDVYHSIMDFWDNCKRDKELHLLCNVGEEA